MIVSDVSWRSRWSTWRGTRRLEDSEEPGKQPFDHVEPFYIMKTFSLFHQVHDGSWMATLLGLPALHTRWYLHCSWLYPCLEWCWWIVEIRYSSWLRKMWQGYAWEETSVVDILANDPVGAINAPGSWWGARALLGEEVVCRGLTKVLFTEMD